MPTANQYVNLLPPWKGWCNKGNPMTRPPDTFAASRNWMCGPGTGYSFVTRWGTVRWATYPTRPLNYIGDFSDQNSEGAQATYCVTYQSGGVPGDVMIYSAGGWVALAGPGITNVSALVRTHITFDLAGTDYVLYCDGVGQPIKINLGAGTYAAFASAPEVYKACMVVADRLVVGNLATSGPEWVDCSSAINFEAGWNTNMVKLADTTGPIVAMRSMGATQGVIYKSDAIYLCIPQTGPAPFRYELRASGIRGPVNEQAIVVLPDNTHMWVGNDGQVYRFDGSNVMPALPLCDNPLMFLTPDQMSSIQAVYWKERQEAYFFYPIGTFPGLADYFADGGALLINYPDMTAFPLHWPYHFVQAVFPPWGYYWQFNPGLVGFGWPYWGGAGMIPVRSLIFSGNTLHIEDPLSHTSWILASKNKWPRGMGSSADGAPFTTTQNFVDPTNTTGIHTSLTFQEMAPADGALITPIETEWMMQRVANCNKTPYTEQVTPSATLRRYGKTSALTGQAFDAVENAKHGQGFSASTANSLSLALNGPGDFTCPVGGVGYPGGLYQMLELSGVRFAFYSGTQGRR